ncbi:DUF4350 domain-containing protein [Geomobilimonas luticola]|uniref:DUF4350 domain-containing protein n=1 Tax=Geomobilimonas luticola TaxID=1114878 RepID=A0ABS5S8E9_9BACT|nr:DUF4350 domain-containing protein [Geomobilimonas luticola]MBT0651634.1 DUF4350 domain-containing protein [Geomobilimonas luticola]
MIMALTVLLAASVSRAGDRPSALFDEGHGQRFTIGEKGPLHLAGLAERFRAGGFEVKKSDGPLDGGILETADVLILSGPFTPYAAGEVAAIARFLERGGRLAAMLHVGPPLADLLHRIGVDFSNGVIREQDNVIDGNPLNFRVASLAGDPLMAGLDGFSVYGCWALTNTDSRAAIIASTGPRASVDLGTGPDGKPLQAVQSFGVAVAGKLGQGRFVVFGDDAIFQNRFLDVDNRHLADNLVQWLN